MRAPLLALALAAAGAPGALASCVSSSLALPARPAATRAAGAVSPLTVGHWSEAVTLLRRPPDPIAAASQVNCPHLDASVKRWEDAATWLGAGVPLNGSSVDLPPNTKVLVSKCSQLGGFIFNLVTVPASSELIFADNNALTFDAYGINVLGALRAGSPTCRLAGRLTITLHGSRNAQVNPGAGYVKGILVDGGNLDLHGVQYQPTWTRLATTAKPGDTWILVQDVVNWEAGQTLVLTTTELKDTRDFNRNEPATILQVQLSDLNPTLSWVQLSKPLQYLHYAGREYQAEVLLLSRRIVVQGDADNSEPTDVSPLACSDNIPDPYYSALTEISTYPCTNSYLTGFGGHIRVQGAGANGRLAGVELYRMGQTNVLGRYPIHFHLVGNASNSWVKESAVHRSFFRCYAVHGTYNVTLLENTAYDAIGHCYFLEDGVEERNSFLYNAGAHVHQLGNPQYISEQQMFGNQYLSNTVQSSTLLLPSDLGASVFYITNAYNTFIGNAASGGFAGYSFPNLPLPVKLFANVTNFVPMNRPLIKFQGNSAHSTAYWWGQAGGIYVGGILTQDANAVLTYNPGRDLSRSTCSDPSQTWCDNALQVPMLFEDSKVFLANRGLQDWGDMEVIRRIEIHDVNLAMNVFGQVLVQDMLMECRSAHVPTWMSGCAAWPTPSDNPWTPGKTCNDRDMAFWTGFNGFQWYDTGQQHLLSNVTFRNCNAQQWASVQPCIWGCGGNSSTVWTLLTHSDQYLPQVMQVTEKIHYDNVDPNLLWGTSTQLTDPGGNTMSGRLQSWLDMDGSASVALPFPGKTRMGSSWSNDWWKLSNQCVLKQQFWICPEQSPQDSAASIYVNFDATLQGGIGSAVCVNGNWDINHVVKCPIVAQVTHWGRTLNQGLNLGVNSQITGPIITASGGWYLQFTKGTPATLSFADFQIPELANLTMAIPYPAGTTFSVVIHAATWCDPSWGTCSHPMTKTASLAAVRASQGDLYYFDGNVLYFRLIEIQGGDFGNPGTVPAVWKSPPNTANTYWTGPDGMYLADQTYDTEYSIVIKATCPGVSNGVCPVNTQAQVPPAVNSEPPSSAFPSAFPTPMPTWWPTSTNAPSTKSPVTTSSPVTRSPSTHKPTKHPVTTKRPTIRPTRRSG